MEKIKMTLGVSLVLNEIVEKLLYTVKEVDGKKMIVDRELPFRLRYRLNRNYNAINKDAKYFDMQRMMLMAKYGTPTEDGKNVVISEENQEEYKKSISDLIDSVVEHTIMTLEPDDIVLIKDTDIVVSPDAMSIFIGYMTNDPALLEEITTEVKLVKHNEEVDKPTEVVASTDTAPKAEAVNSTVEEVKATVPVVEGIVTEPKKTRAKRATKTSGTSKATKAKKAAKAKEE